MIQKIRDSINSCWARHKAFRALIITAFLLVITAPLFLLALHARVLFGVSFLVFFFIVRLVFGYAMHKEGYVDRAKNLSSKAYYTARRISYIVGGGLLTGFSILTILTVLYGRLPYPHSFLLFLSLVAIGMYIGNWMNKRKKSIIPLCL
jgi:hypothetical protein